MEKLGQWFESGKNKNVNKISYKFGQIWYLFMLNSIIECYVWYFSDDYLVRVKAQVMTRDDSTGGWVPMGGGGMSIVGLRKLVINTADDIKHEYLIHGQRIADQSVSIYWCNIS